MQRKQANYALRNKYSPDTSGFIGTNLGNLVLLVAFYSRYGQHPDLVSGGYSGGMLIIGAISYINGVTGGFILVNYLGFLGPKKEGGNYTAPLNL